MIVVDVNPYKSVIVLDEEENPILVSEGDKIEFVLESGEVKKGTVTKLNGKNEKLKIQMLNEEKTHEEIWPIISMAEGSLKLVEETDEN